MQKARIRTGWKNKTRTISIEDFANAVSAICWRIALNAAKNLHQQDFIYDTDKQRVAVIEQYLIFLVHVSDRLMSKGFDQSERIRFMTELAVHCQRHYVQNHQEIMSDSTPLEQLKRQFIDSFNKQSEALSLTKFGGEEPGYDMYRLIAANIQQIMGNSQTNKWVIDQVMDIDGPNCFELYAQSLKKLRRSSGF